jgi:hypothetical protein
MEKEEHAPNLLDENTHVIEITPEQFCTMQNMFRTQVPMQMNPQMTTSFSSSVSESLPNLPKEINAHDFSTMQMLFQTQSGANQPNV